MSTAVFPALAGLEWGIKLIPIWSTQKQHTASQRELRATFVSYPLYRITLSYSVLRKAVAFAEIQNLVGFFNARQGAFDSFYYLNPDDNATVDSACGNYVTGTTVYYATKTYGSFVEPIGAFNGNPTNVKVGGVTKVLGTDYSVAGNKITFITAQTNGAAITWTGSFYYNVTFVRDDIEFEQFLQDLWTAKKVELVTVKT